MKLTLRLGDDYLVIKPFLPDEIRSYLSYWHKEFKVDPETYKKSVQGKTELLYNEYAVVDDDGNLGYQYVTFPGFYSGVYTKLTEDLLYEVEVIDERMPRPEYDIKEAIKVLRRYQYECTYTALYGGGGVIACPTGWGKTYIMASIIKGYSHDNLKYRGTPLTVVVTPGTDLLLKNYEDLKAALPERNVGVVGGGKRKLSDDVMLSTPESLDNLPMSTAGLLIYDEVHSLSRSRAERVMKATRALRFGLSATPSGRFDGADKVIEGIMGPVVYRRTYQQAIEDGAVVPIRVLWVKLPPPTGWHSYKTRDGAYRNGIWRNQVMAEFLQRLWDFVNDDVQILGVVDKLDQMDFLANFLNDTEFVHAETNAKSIQSKRLNNIQAISKKIRNEIYGKIRDGEITRVISTGIYRQGVSFPDLRVLVNLAGMKSEIIAGQLPGRTSRTSDGKDYGYIVDFWHDWDQIDKDGRMTAGHMLRDDMSREKVYRENGFEQKWIESIQELEILND